MKGTRKLLASTKILIAAGFASIFLLFGIVLWLALATMKTTNQNIATLIEDTDRKTSSAYQMRDLIRLRSAQVNKLQLSNEPEAREKTTDKLAELTARYNSTRLELESGGLHEREKEITDKIDEVNVRINNAYSKTADALFSMLENNTKVDAAVGELQLLELVLLKHLNDLVELEKTVAAELLETNQKSYTDIQKTLSILALVAIVVGVIIAAIVVSRVSRAGKRIAHLANHDDLTGLKNRRAFESHLQETLKIANKRKAEYGLLFLDLDRFKVVNDTCGHHAGDQLLIGLTQLVEGELGSKDHMFRLGGDEFGIIATSESFTQITDLAENICKAASEFIFEYENREFSISTSIGVIPLTGEELNTEILMTNVDSACYVAKESGRNRVHVARKDDVQVLHYRKSLESVEKIREALNKEQFELFYQPIFDIKGDQPVLEHCEILLRIKNADGQLYTPEDFIPLAEKYNLMSGIDRWVVSHVIDWIEQHQAEANLPRILINLSALSYIDEVFLAFLVNKLENTSIDTSRLAFEITETAAVNNIELANNFLDRIREFGCRFALDDFGTGFSTFAYLKQLPIDYLKIDGSLVRSISHNSIDREMVRAINEVGHIVGAKTIAEFVENDEIVQTLKSLNVDYGQGFGLQRPAKIDGLLEMPGVRTGPQDNDQRDIGGAA